MKSGFVSLFILFLSITGFSQKGDVLLTSASIDSLLTIAEQHQSKDEFQEMHDIAASAASIALQNWGDTHVKYAKCLYLQARAIYSLRQYDESQEILEKALKIYDSNGIIESIDYVEALHLKGLVYTSLRKYTEAEELLTSAIKIMGKVMGNEHPDYAETLGDLGVLYFRMGQFDKAVPLYEESKSIRSKVLGKEHSKFTTSLNNLAAVYMKMGLYDKAEPNYTEAISIYGKTKGKDHPDYANSLNNLAVLYGYMGRYNKAEQLSLEAKSVQEKALGKNHHDYATSLNNLGNFYSVKGNYELAEALMTEALTIRKKVFGDGHPRYAISLHLQADLYRNMGNYEKAEPLIIEANAIFRKVLGKEHPRYATGINELADLYSDIANYEKAEPLFKEAISIRENTLGKDHPKYAKSLSNLAVLQNKMGQFKSAETLFVDAKIIYEKALNKEHSDYALNLYNLAGLYAKTHQNKKAEEYFKEAISVQKRALGEDHPDLRASLNRLAKVYYAEKEYGQAGPYFSSANDINKTLLERAADHLSGVELQKYLLKFESNAAMHSSFIHQSKSTELLGEWYNNSLFYKGFLLGNALRIEREALNAPDSIKEVYYEWKSYCRRLSTEYSKPISDRKNVAELEEKANSLEKLLLKNTPELKDVRRQIDWMEVRDQLKEGETAIEFIHHKYYDPDVTDSIFYSALVLRPGVATPQQIFLFEEKELNKILEPKGERKADYVNALYSLSSRGVIVEEDSDNKTLYELIWTPLKQTLEGVKTIYFAPSGLLHRINLGAIPVNEVENLAGQYDFILLNSTRQLVLPSHVHHDNEDIVLFGGIIYDHDSTTIAGVKTEMRGGTWSYLSGTEREVSKLESMMQKNDLITSTFSGLYGTEEQFKSQGQTKSSPRVMHIATHGYFFPDPKKSDGGLSNENEPIFKVSDQPMLRSGLILAGGNHNWMGEKPPAGQEDGILTALEISQMDLSHTELVVLSACETGLGEIQGNEGVYGLQRAFKIAGVKNIIMSLWQVPDKQTSTLMQQFYSNWLEEKMPIRKAFTSAQNNMWEMGFDPYFWAGFVLVE